MLKTRLAPTPSGYLHIGNVLSFAITWALAKQKHGKIVLRIDDLDASRFRTEYVQDIFDTLAFLGIDYDEGPRNIAEFDKVYSQQLRTNRYRQMLNCLIRQNHLYACNCSRSQIQTASPTGLYQRTCQNKGIHLEQSDSNWRVKVPENCSIEVDDMLEGKLKVALGSTMSDFVVKRRDNIPAYQIASLADDLEMGINLIVRGYDLLTSTAAQLFLAHLLGEDKLGQTCFLHHPLLKTALGEKLSKSKGDTSIYMLRNNGIGAQKIWKDIAQHLKLNSNAIATSYDFLDAFEVGHLKRI